MFADYESLVVQSYRDKRDANTLSPRLLHLTPANLKEECIAVCEERYERKDDGMLRTFFKMSGDRDTCLRVITQCGIDKFRPLKNFLEGKTSTTDEKNIELLAWLIDFKPRPFDLQRKYNSDNSTVSDNSKEKEPVAGNYTEEENAVHEPAGIINEEWGMPVPQQLFSTTLRRGFKNKLVIIAAMILVTAGGLIYWVWSDKAAAVVQPGNGWCMYWAEDHYEPISCNQKPAGNTLVVALDSQRISNFKKITRIDTITSRSKGFVWYVKINNTVEFYTADGFHPVDIRLRLRPITDYIIRKYIPAP